MHPRRLLSVCVLPMALVLLAGLARAQAPQQDPQDTASEPALELPTGEPLDLSTPEPDEIKGAKPDRAWIDHLLQRVGLGGFGSKFPRELSGGMQQRASIVRALALKPSVLLMDEPFGALDSFTREEMNRLVEEIWLDRPTTIVFITHSIEEAIFLSDRVIVMSARPGRVAREYQVPFARPRSLEIMATKEVFDLQNAIKLDIVGGRTSQMQAPLRSAVAAS